MKKIVCVVGTRPEVVKMAPVVAALRARPDDVECRVVMTGQHRELVEPLVAWFDLRPDVVLDVMAPNQGLAGLTARLLVALDDLVEAERPDWILAQGDTTSVLAASLAAFYRRVPFGHVEAGLRTPTVDRPFPEEFNRRAADLAAAAYFCPTDRAAAALRGEGAPEERIVVTGNTGIDALLQTAGRPAPPPPPALREAGRWVLVTAHRRESFGAPLEALCRALARLARRFPQLPFLYPVHLNPNVREPVNRLLAGIGNLHLVEPLAYPAMVHCMKDAALILTDSGGVQEEAPSLGVPVLVMREETERPEAVDAGMARLVGTDEERIVAEATAALEAPGGRATWYQPGPNPFGDGKAGERIAAWLAG